MTKTQKTKRQKDIKDIKLKNYSALKFKHYLSLHLDSIFGTS